MHPTRRHLMLALPLAGIGGLAAPRPAPAANSGIAALIAVAQQKTQSANEAALGAADRQRALVSAARDKRAAKAAVDGLDTLRRELGLLQDVLDKAAAELARKDC